VSKTKVKVHHTQQKVKCASWTVMLPISP